MENSSLREEIKKELLEEIKEEQRRERERLEYKKKMEELRKAQELAEKAKADAEREEKVRKYEWERSIRKKEAIYSERYSFRWKMFIISAVLSIPSVVSMFTDQFQQYNWLIYLTALASNSFLWSMFFVGIGKPEKKARKTRASSVLFITIMLSLQLLCIGLLEVSEHLYDKDYEYFFYLYLGASVIAIIISVINKIVVNTHNQE